MPTDSSVGNVFEGIIERAGTSNADSSYQIQFESSHLGIDVPEALPEPEYRNGIPISVQEPYREDRSWFITNPGAGIYLAHENMVFYSRQFSQHFRLGLRLITMPNDLWEITWIEEDEIYPDEEPTAEYDGYEIGEPFFYSNRLYVVFNEPPFYGEYSIGERYWSEYEGTDFILGSRVRDDLFGSEYSYRAEWVTEQDIEDGYSEEIIDFDIAIEPVVMTKEAGRDIPLVSIEQELTGNGNKVVTKLYEAGLSYLDYVDGYHQSSGRREDMGDSICYVETDSSCGYEIVFSKIDMTDRLVVEGIARAQEILQELRDSEDIRISARCGFHVHVDVSNWGMKEIVSAYHLWNYLEDSVFRFSSAFWNSHRDEEVGGGYSPSIPKGLDGRTSIGRGLGARRDSLNFTHILDARGNCGCSASFYEDWINCTCNLRQPTLEFRVFNATMNPRKIRAYLAFCVAFVNMAKTHEHSPEFFPEMRWRGTNVKREDEAGEDWFDASIKRIKYILEEFPLTQQEKSDIMYCFRNCSLEPVMEFV